MPLSILGTAACFLVPTPNVIENPSYWYYAIMISLVGNMPVYATFSLVQAYTHLDVDKIKSWRNVIYTYLAGGSSGAVIGIVSYYIWVILLEYNAPVPFLGRIRVNF